MYIEDLVDLEEIERRADAKCFANSLAIGMFIGNESNCNR